MDEYILYNIREWWYFLDNMKYGLFYKCVYLKFSVGNNFGLYNFLWKILGGVLEIDSDVM